MNKKKFFRGIAEGTCAASTMCIGLLSLAAAVNEFGKLHVVDGVKLTIGGVGLVTASAVTMNASAETVADAEFEAFKFFK